MGGQTRGQKKWVVWEEGGLYPSLAIELLSPSTEGKDRGQKLVIYRDHWQMGDYFLFESDSAKHSPQPGHAGQRTRSAVTG